MAIYAYQAREGKNRVRRGLLRAPDEERGRCVLRSAGLEPLEVRRYCAPPDFLPLLVSSIFVVVAVFGFMAVVKDDWMAGRWSRGLLHTAILAGIVCFVVLAYRVHQRQSLPRRTKSHLDVPLDGEESYLLDSVEGEFIPEEDPKPVLVNEEGVVKSRVLVGKVERAGFPNYAQLMICIAGYYTAALLLWSTLGSAERTILGRTVPGWGLAVGLSFLLLPALVISLGLKLRLYAVITVAAIAVLIQFLWLRGAYLHNPVSAPVYEILVGHPLHAVLGWLVPAAVMIILERNRKIKELLRLEVPVYDEET